MRLVNGLKLRTSSLAELEAEVERARRKFPGNRHLLAALTEELGEVANAILEHGNGQRMREEAVQVACVAMRLYEEGDPDFDGPAQGSGTESPRLCFFGDCGGDPLVNGEENVSGYFVQCPKCMAFGPTAATSEKAVRLWDEAAK